MVRSLTVSPESWPISGGFAISRGTKTHADVVVAEVTDGKVIGRGECTPYARYNETVDGVVSDIAAMSGAVADGLTREQLQTAMPAGAARNALDCALLDLEAKTDGRSVLEILDLAPPNEVVTAYTLSLGTPESMGAAAREAAHRPLIKVKLGGAGDAARILAVRENAPDSSLIVDANEAWRDHLFDENMAACAAARVDLIEQPLPAGADSFLAGISRQVPVCADESVHTLSELEALTDRYDAVNVKLDKAGGMTEAALMVKRARELGLTVMIGSMLATSLAMAPAYFLAGYAEFIDIDGPLLLAEDRVPGLAFEGSLVLPPQPALWG